MNIGFNFLKEELLTESVKALHYEMFREYGIAGFQLIGTAICYTDGSEYAFTLKQATTFNELAFYVTAFSETLLSIKLKKHEIKFGVSK